MNNNLFFNPNANLMRSVPFTNVSYVPRSSGILGGLLGGRSAASGISAAGASKVTFSGILNGASKTLGVINQAIPVFYQVKPMINNAKTMFRVAKEINSSNNNNTINNNNNKREEVITKKEEDNSPTFFI